VRGADPDGVAACAVDVTRVPTRAERRSLARGRRNRLLQLPVPIVEEWQVERRLRKRRQRSPFRAMNAS
jgi:hypothetical protein